LLDVNVLLALADPRHVHNELALDWFQRIGRGAWATCPLTENGFVRIMSHASYPNRPGGVALVLGLLNDICVLPGHEFWADEISLREALRAGDQAVTSSQLTDLYLLALAAHMGGHLATLDGRINVSAVDGGDEALEIIV
jgi:uncharacterized protein